jgi:hypothetical protein
VEYSAGKSLHNVSATRPLLLLSLAGIFAAQKLIEVRVDRIDLEVRTVLGFIVSVLLVLFLVEYGLQPFTRRLGIPGLGKRPFEFALLGVATIGVVLTVGSAWTYGYVVAYATPLPTAILIVAILAWSGAASWLLSAPRSPTQWMVVLTAATLTTRALGCVYSPVSGDMIATVSRALDMLLAGEQPYRVYPPAMPYFPLTFLSYLPSRLMDIDLRWSNVVVESAIVVAVMHPARHRPCALATAALPVLGLWPQWVIYGIDTTFPLSVLCVVLIGNSLVHWTGRPILQGVLAGAMVAANQTLAFLTPFIGLRWWAERGTKAALRQVAVAAFCCAVFVLPFVVWDPPSFLSAAFGLRPFAPEELAGRFSLRLPLERVVPGTAGVVALAVAIAAAAASLGRNEGASIVVYGAIAYVVFLLMLHRTFSHYFLPPVAAVLVFAPFVSERSPRRRDAGGRR